MPLMPRLKIEKIVFGVVQLRSAANIFFDCMNAREIAFRFSDPS
jgi:hypothetical protein